MTFNNGRAAPQAHRSRSLQWLSGIVLCLLASAALAALGDSDASIAHDASRMVAVRQMRQQSSFTVHTLQQADGSVIHQFATPDHRIFAITWRAQHKPDLSVLLGSSYASYVQGVQAKASEAGVQRHFEHQALDLVVQSSGYLNVFKGYAYRPSMVPAGFSLSADGLSGLE